MELNTHLAINRSLCGQIISVDEGKAVVKLDTIPEMVADAHQLVHGGFIFGAADFAAMAAVNDPNVVLGSAEVRFLKPTKCGDAVTLEAKVAEIGGKKHRVEVEGVDEAGTKVFSGIFTCFVLEKHVLEK
ncbi:MAG: PaaI family thioesterase [Geobacteraceae bacterium]|nr:PaaI family thioesterase [Geobacteraceae bacterium]